MTRMTTQQQAFVDAVVRLERNIALIARAGTGKTTTILAAVTRAMRTFTFIG